MHNTSKEAIVRVPASEKNELTWEEQSGFLEFLSAIPSEVAKFNESMEFGLNCEVSPPQSIDGDKKKAAQAGLLISRRNGIFPQRTFCLYFMFKQQSLHAYIATIEHGMVETHSELEPLDNFQEGSSALYDWLRELVRVSSKEL